MAGGWSCIVRFVCHVPFGMVGVGGGTIYDTLRVIDHTGIYDVIPNGRSFLYGLQMYLTWGVFGCAWNFVMFLGCIACNSYLCILLGVVDLMIALALAVSVGKQAQFIPTSYGACGAAADWRNGTDGRNFFIAANETAFPKYGGPDALCYIMVKTWAVTIAVVILYGLTGIINIALGLAVVYSEGGRRYRNTYDNNTNTRTGEQQRGEFVSWLLTPVMFVLDHPLTACRFGFLYIHRALRRGRLSRQKREKSAHGPAEQPSAGKLSKQVSDADDHNSVLPPELLRRVSEQLHFVDLVNASHSSKKLRAQLFGSDQALSPEQFEELQRITCKQGTKSSCDLCGNQTCAECETKQVVPASPASRHLTGCQPCCSRCFYKTYCRWWAPHGQRLARHTSRCHLAENKARQSRSRFEMRTRADCQAKTLCRMCTALTQAEREASFEDKDGRELDRLTRLPLTCVECREMLPARGPRWWKCQECGAECTSHVHPPWAAT